MTERSEGTGGAARPVTPPDEGGLIAARRHAEPCMGTVFSFDLRPPYPPAGVLEQVLAWLHRMDATFSTYRPDSDISRLGRGEVAVGDCAPEVAEVLGRCDELAEATGGCFSAYAGGVLDPSGLVKGWAVERASAMLRAAGSVRHSVNGGGDIRLAGETEPGRPWRVGIADPLRPGGLAAVVTGRDLAVATSGTAERGAHILDPRTGRPPGGLASVTVVGPSLTLADAYATAAFVMGEEARAWIDGTAGYEAFAVTETGRTWVTAGAQSSVAIRSVAPARPLATRPD
jgi:FAD:protein FMN transferase